jgi:hypothetical protein
MAARPVCGIVPAATTRRIFAQTPQDPATAVPTSLQVLPKAFG